MIVVATCGGFDPIHVGHVEHLQMARALGDCLVVIVNPDIDMVNKKGYCFMPLEERMAIIKAFRCVDDVMESIDEDGTVAETLKALKPDILAKGGDRRPENMPQNEIDACREINCEIRYGVGEKIQSSSDLTGRLKWLRE